MKPLSFTALLISINLSFVVVNAKPRLFEHRHLPSEAAAEAEVLVMEKYTCSSIIAIEKLRGSGWKEEVEVRVFCLTQCACIQTKHLTTISSNNFTADH